MNVGTSIRKSIDDWELEDYESAMLHACNAVDGTAKKSLPSIISSNQRFTDYIRQNYDIFGPMACPGINLEKTRFPVTVDRPKAAGGKPDIADIIYGIHRCTHGHGLDLPNGFELINDAGAHPGYTRMSVEKGKIRLSDRVIFGLLALAVFDPNNGDQTIPDTYYLTFDGDKHKLLINENWGKINAFRELVNTVKLPRVILDFNDWMT